MKREMVSAVIPSYNREKLITRSIASVLNQTWQAFEIIVVDDALTDDTARAIAGINDSRIHYIRLEENRVGSKVGLWLLTRCFILGRWQDEMRRMGILSLSRKIYLRTRRNMIFGNQQKNCAGEY